MIDIRKVGTEAVSIIQNLANITWPVAYGDILSPQELDYMMELMYSKASLQKQMEKGHQFVLAYDAENPVAFASYSPKQNNSAIYKLHKLYILPNQQKKGIGKLLIHYITKDIPATTLQLNIHRNSKAVYFYEKLGFKIIAQEDINIGNDFYMHDYVMEMKW
jgi:diamine N-acetyltransferase